MLVLVILKPVNLVNDIKTYMIYCVHTHRGHITLYETIIQIMLT